MSAEETMTKQTNIDGIPFETTVHFRPAWEKRHDDPAKDYGVGSVRIRFTLTAPNGALSWRLSSGWYLPNVRERFRREAPHKRYDHDPSRFMPCALEGEGLELTVHFPAPPNGLEGNGPNECDLLPSGKCWTDVGFSIGETLFEALVAGGEDGLWKEMARIHREQFA